MMMIREITENKKEYLPLLLLADEQESMIALYLERGTMYVLEQETDVKAVCVVTDEGEEEGKRVLKLRIWQWNQRARKKDMEEP